MLRTALLLIVLASCVRSSSTECGETLCPEGTRCAVVTIAQQPTDFCVQPVQLASCVDREDGSECDAASAPGTCHGEVCLANACGNGLVDRGEACDDGNTVARDGCSSTCHSTEICGNSEVDVDLPPGMAETCDDGGLRSHDGCASACRVEQPTWTALETAHPGQRDRAAFAYDVARRRFVVFGGITITELRDDTLEWDGARWSRPRSAVTPLRAPGGVMAYDTQRARLVLFDGRETWERDARGAWELRPTTTKPDNVGYQAVYDERHQRVVMLGAQTWSWDGIEWRASPLPPWTPRSDFALGYDAHRGVIVAFGGAQRNFGHADVWELDGDLWTNPTPVTRPTPRRAATFAFDRARAQLVLVGGTDFGQINPLPSPEAWAWDGTTWARLADTIPMAMASGIADHAAATDATTGRVTVLDAYGALQILDGETWVRVAAPPGASSIPARGYHAGAVDPLARELVVFGGAPADGPGAAVGGTWIWDGAWRQLAIAEPSARVSASMVYDEARRELVLFGGCTSAETFAQTWRFRERTWSLATPSSMPPRRCYHASVYDPLRREVVVVGGRNDTNLDDTWRWDGTTWTAVVGDVRPPAVTGAAFGFDRLRGHAVHFGGFDTVGPSDATWIWDGMSWRAAAAATRPTARAFSTLAWDATRQQLLLFGGADATGTLDDVWAWNGAGWDFVALAADGPSPRSRHLMTPALDGAGVLLVGGLELGNTSRPLADVWQLRWDANPYDEVCTDHDTDGDGAIGCLDPDCEARCAPLPDVRCGDGVCDVPRESCFLCSGDCGSC